MYDRMVVRCMLNVFITNDIALCMLEHNISLVQQIGNIKCLFKCGETGLYTLHGAHYTATLVQGA